MDWTTAGKASTIRFDIQAYDEPAVPDAGSLKLTIRDNSGEIIAPYDDLALDDTIIDSVTVSIPASVNTIGAYLFESRYVGLSYTVEGVPYGEQKVYRLTPFLPIQATKEDVRSHLGADAREVPDADIDLVESYFLLVSEQGDGFKTALTSATMTGIQANKCIALHAAIKLLPALPAKLRQMEQFDNSEFQRMKVDFARLRQDLEVQLDENLREVMGTTTSLKILLMVSNPADVITGT